MIEPVLGYALIRCQVKPGSVCFRTTFFHKKIRLAWLSKRIHDLRARLSQKSFRPKVRNAEPEMECKSPNISSLALCRALSDILLSVISRHKTTLPTGWSGG